MIESPVRPMEFHEVANLFPFIEGQEFDDLVNDIRDNGLQQPIWTYQGKIIDGRNRYRACLSANVEPRFQEWNGNGSLISFAVSMNIKRRHLDSSQKAMIAAQSLSLYEAEAKLRHGGDHKSKEYQDQKNLILISGASVALAAKDFGTNAQYVGQAKNIIENTPELVEHVTNGTLTVPDAKAVAELPEERRADIVQKAVKGKKDTGKRASKTVKAAVKAVKTEVKKEKKQKEIAHLQQSESNTATAVMEVVDRQVTPGQLWKLGRHTLYCGDSASETFQALCNKSFASFAFADPPYNAGVAEWDTNFIWKHDYLIDVAPIVAVTPGISAIKDFMLATSMPYKWSMAYQIDNGMTRGAVGFGNWIYASLFTHDSLYRNAQDFEKLSISSVDRDELEHKGRKPLAMMLHIIKLFTEQGQTVIDPFLGTGTTLIVCEQLDRICIGAEMNTDYCMSIIKRWEKASGLMAEVMEWQ